MTPREALLPGLDQPTQHPPGKQFKLLGPDGQQFLSTTPGTFGGNKWSQLYGRFDCPAALRALASGGYERNRVFFASEADALLAGYRPCGACMQAEYRKWLRGELWFDPATLFPTPV
jgi:hypothetical protein